MFSSISGFYIYFVSTHLSISFSSLSYSWNITQPTWWQHSSQCVCIGREWHIEHDFSVVIKGPCQHANFSISFNLYFYSRSANTTILLQSTCSFYSQDYRFPLPAPHVTTSLYTITISQLVHEHKNTIGPATNNATWPTCNWSMLTVNFRSPTIPSFTANSPFQLHHEFPLACEFMLHHDSLLSQPHPQVHYPHHWRSKLEVVSRNSLAFSQLAPY